MKNADVKSLSVTKQPLVNWIPREIEKFFPDLTSIYFSESNITTISADDLKPFLNLLKLYLPNNKLVTLDGDLFQYTRKLQVVWIQINSLQHVGHDLLTGLNDLTMAYFHSNPCINIYATTREAVQQLNLQLPISCPPLETTTTVLTTITSGYCSSACSDQIKAAEQKVSMEINGLSVEISELKDVDKKKTEVIEGLEKRLVELEKLFSGIVVP